MVRGNWQKRVETAQARRKVAKQRKQRSENTRQYKQWMHDFLGVLDRHCDRLQLLPPANYYYYCKLKIWSDTAPRGGGDRAKDGEFGEVSIEKAAGSGIKKAKGEGSESSHKKSSTSGSSNSSSKKKAHPRSKETTTRDKVMEEEPHDHQWMCRSYFFTGKCSEGKAGGKKSSGCRYIHENNAEEESYHQQTLFQALSCSKDAKNQLKEADEAVQAAMLSSDDSTATEHPGAMDAVFFVEEMNQISHSEEDGDKSLSSWSSQITALLAKKQLRFSNVVYIVLNNVLVFDRHREGSVFDTDRDFLIAILGEEVVMTKRESIGNETDTMAKFQDLQGPILEYILTFLPDEAVASCSQVCKAWHHEIGKNSPNLWRHMLNRRCWPHPRHDEIEEYSLEQHHYREQFLEHFLLMRDLNAIQSGLQAIADHCHGRNPRVAEKEMVFQNFSSRRESPFYCSPGKHDMFPQNRCVGIHEWSAKCVLAAYSNDCSLRLFEAVPKKGSNGERSCREQICIRVNPYPDTKKRMSILVSMDLDEEFIGNLCQIQTSEGDGVYGDRPGYALVVVSRSDFLLGESLTGSNAESFHIIDVTKSVLNYMVSEGREDDRFEALFDFLSRGGELDKVGVIVSHKLIGCGSGMFMTMTRISIPGDVNVTYFHALFSVTAGAIVWMGDAFRWDAHEACFISFSHLRHSSQRDGNSLACSVAVSARGRSIDICDIKRSGEVQIANIPYISTVPSDEAEPVSDAAERFDWLQYSPDNADDQGSRPIVVTATEIICADTFSLVRQVAGDRFFLPLLDNEILRRRTILSIFPRHPTVDNSEVATIREEIVLHGNMKVLQMALIRQRHVILLCSGPEGEQSGVPEESDTGQRFVQSHSRDSFFAIVVHLPSRREIGRVHLLDGVGLQIPRFTINYSQTVAVGWGRLGIVMAGSEVRAVVAEDDGTLGHEDLSSKVHNKKKRQPNRGGKKDGFARGMSLRG